jgi:putative hydrolase of the HAD superfamily
VRSGFEAVNQWLWETHSVGGFGKRAWAAFLAGDRGRIFNTVLVELGLPESKSLVQEMVAVYREHHPSITLLPDGDAALSWASESFNVGLITDGYRVAQEQKIAALGLETRIPCRIVTDALGRDYWKPHPEPYRQVMAHFGGEPSGFLYVGDNPKKDFLGAGKMGWRSIRIRRELGEQRAAEAAGPEGQPEAEIADLSELSGLVQRC